MWFEEKIKVAREIYGWIYFINISKKNNWNLRRQLYIAQS